MYKTNNKNIMEKVFANIFIFYSGWRTSLAHFFMPQVNVFREFLVTVVFD